MIKVAIIGGGAAGFFTAVNIAEKVPGCEITILEKSNKLLSKVRISGGGRCNVTNGRSTPGELVKHYPRGQKKLYKGFSQFGTTEMKQWLKKHQVSTKTEPDLRVFPTSDSSETIINCFLGIAKKHKIRIITGAGAHSLVREDSKWIINDSFESDYIVWATGSSPSSMKILKPLNLESAPQVPSLFTFNINDERIKELQGLSFKHVKIKVAGTKLEEEGPLLITHWGLSGPAILKLSAWGARELNSTNYKFDIIINFIGDLKPQEFKNHFSELCDENPKKLVKNVKLEEIPSRYWTRMTELMGIGEMQMGDLGKKQINKIVEECSQSHFRVTGKSTFKDEFVTCGGIELSEVDLSSMETRKHKGLYLAGEVLNIDGITGGFNFQACWTAGWLISEDIKKKADND